MNTPANGPSLMSDALAEEAAATPGAPDRRRIQVISRAVAILRALEGHPDGLGTAELARRVDLPRTTVQRIVEALDREGLVIGGVPGAGVRMGPAILSLAAATRFHVADLARETLRALAREVGETVDLSLADQDRMVFIDQVGSRHRLAIASAVGVSFPMHCCSNGKAALAAMDSAERARVLSRLRLDSYTPRTITSRAALEAELVDVQRSGVAYDREETAIGVCSVAMAFRGPDRGLMALSVIAPIQRFETSAPRLMAALRAQVEALRERLGC